MRIPSGVRILIICSERAENSTTARQIFGIATGDKTDMDTVFGFHWVMFAQTPIWESEAPSLRVLRALFLESCLSRCKSCNRNSEGRARNVGKADLVAEFNRRGISTMLTADTNVKLGTNLLTKGNCHVHELTNANLVKLSEGIVLEDLSLIVSVEELTSVVTAEAVGHLSKVVSTEAEELSLSSDIVSSETTV